MVQAPAVLVPIQVRSSSEAASPIRMAHEYRQERTLERYHDDGARLISIKVIITIIPILTIITVAGLLHPAQGNHRGDAWW